MGPSPIIGVTVVSATLRIRIGDLAGWRYRREAFSVAEVNRIPGTEHQVIGAGATHERLMKIVAGSKLVGEFLKQWRIAGIDIIKRQRIAAAVISAPACNRDEWVQIVQAIAVVFSGAAIRLLPHLEKAMDRVAAVGVVGQVWSG